MNENQMLTETATRLAHFLTVEHQIGGAAGVRTASTAVRDRLQSDGVEFEGVRLTLRDRSLIAWAGESSDPDHERLVEVILD